MVNCNMYYLVNCNHVLQLSHTLGRGAAEGRGGGEGGPEAGEARGPGDLRPKSSFGTG